MKPTNSSTQGQPNPRKIRLRSGILAVVFPTIDISWVRTGFILETDYKKLNPTILSANNSTVV